MVSCPVCLYVISPALLWVAKITKGDNPMIKNDIMSCLSAFTNTNLTLNFLISYGNNIFLAKFLAKCLSEVSFIIKYHGSTMVAHINLPLNQFSFRILVYFCEYNFNINCMLNLIFSDSIYLFE